MKQEALTIMPGPCAVESPEQMSAVAQEAKRRGFDTIRGSLYKPRTKPGFQGLKESGIPILLDIAQQGIRPATEVLIPEHADAVMNGILAKDPNAQLLLWLGSRNQNDIIQKSIGMAISGEPRVNIMIKNQMWRDAHHWMGIVDHVISGGADPNQILLCHRGFAPKSDSFRNPPDMEMALKVKHTLSNAYGVDMQLIVDPSHIAGGSPENVMNIAKTLATYSVTLDGQTIRPNGLMVEVHPNPSLAQTDKEQQLNWNQLDEMISRIPRFQTVYTAQ